MTARLNLTRLLSALPGAALKLFLPFALAYAAMRALSGNAPLTQQLWLCAELLGVWLACMLHMPGVRQRPVLFALAGLLLTHTCLTLDFFFMPGVLLGSATHFLLMVVSVGLMLWSSVSGVLAYAQAQATEVQASPGLAVQGVAAPEVPDAAA